MSGRDAAGLYVHVPFCRRVCPYCDFAVRTGRDEQVEAFVETLTREAGLWIDWTEPFDTLYLGGGTPSRLSDEGLGRVVTALSEALPVRPDAWATLEVNPEDVDSRRVRAWRDLGFRGLSLGVQSFEEGPLRFLARQHDPAQARRSVELALEAGFDWVSVDLIYGLPGQDEAALRRDLAAAVALGVPHLSCYQLTVHEGTTFGRWREIGRLREAPDDSQARHFETVHAVLADAGLPAYEVSNFARSERFESRHNRKYWAHVPYLGLGPSAHSFRGRERWWNVRDVRAWSARVERGDRVERGVEGREHLTSEQLALEALLLGLRTSRGIDLAEYAQRHGVDLVAGNAERLAALEADGRCTLDAGRLRLTRRGLLVADRIAAELRVDRAGEA